MFAFGHWKQVVCFKVLTENEIDNKELSRAGLHFNAAQVIMC